MILDINVTHSKYIDPDPDSYFFVHLSLPFELFVSRFLNEHILLNVLNHIDNHIGQNGRKHSYYHEEPSRASREKVEERVVRVLIVG